MALAGLYRVVQDVAGNIVTDVLGTVTMTGTSTLAALFSDSAGTLPLPNPTTNNAQYGSFNLFVAAGTYDMQFVKSGYMFEMQRNIVLRDPAAGVNTITGTANRVIVAPVPGVGAVTLSTPQDIAPDSAVQFGRLGLGTPATSYALTVSGEMTVSSTAQVGQLGAGRAPQAGFSGAFGGSVTIGGNLGIGTDAPGYNLDVAGSLHTSGNVGIAAIPGVGITVTIGPGKTILQAGGILGIQVDPGYTLHVNGTAGIQGGAWANTASSATLKQHIRSLDDPLALLGRLQPRRWEWADEQPDLEALLPGTQAGFVIEEVAQVHPAWQVQDAEGTPGLAMRGLDAYLVAAVQALVARLEAVEGVCMT